MNKTYLIDLDGTMYHGSKIIPEAKKFIDYLIERKINFIFLTNNATRTKKQNVEHMLNLGFEHIEEKHFYTSSMAAAMYISSHYEQNTCFYIGEEGLKESLLNEGFVLTEENPDFVFVGLSLDANYELYTKALQYLLNGAILVGTNDDRRLPSSTGYKVGNGAIIKMLSYASSKQSIPIGKPHATILEECLSYFSLTKEEVIIIGDNLETDILLGVNTGVDTIFVTSGVHNINDIETLKIFPTKTIHTLLALIEK